MIKTQSRFKIVLKFSLLVFIAGLFFLPLPGMIASSYSLETARELIQKWMLGPLGGISTGLALLFRLSTSESFWTTQNSEREFLFNVFKYIGIMLILLASLSYSLFYRKFKLSALQIVLTVFITLAAVFVFTVIPPVQMPRSTVTRAPLFTLLSGKYDPPLYWETILWRKNSNYYDDNFEFPYLTNN